MKTNLQLFGGRGGGSGLGAGGGAGASGGTDYQNTVADLAKNFDDMTFGDMMATIEAYAMTHPNVDEDKMYDEVREKALEGNPTGTFTNNVYGLENPLTSGQPRQTTQKTMRDSSNGFEFSPEKNKNTGTKLTRQPSKSDLIDAPAGTVFVSDKGTMYTKQSNSHGFGGSMDFTVKTMTGGTLSGISPNALSKKIADGKVTLARKRQANRRDGMGNYVPYA